MSDKTLNYFDSTELLFFLKEKKKIILCTREHYNAKYMQKSKELN